MVSAESSGKRKTQDERDKKTEDDGGFDLSGGTAKNRVRLGVVLEKRESRDGVLLGDTSFETAEDTVTAKEGTVYYRIEACSVILLLHCDLDFILTVCFLE